MDIKDVIIRNYMPYAKGTIISRAIPAIDGFKPSNRRILYAMHHKMNLITKDKSKSAKIVGQVMTYHPHGDASIYETMVRMATGNESLNVPYIESKGNFGKVWSKTMAFAASRYTEAKLAPICAEVFEGLDENAVDMVDNFDSTEKEPSLLPVKFPAILVNAVSGIAVGCSSNIAPFGLSEVCKATIAMIEGTVDNVPDLMEILGAPEFPTGGFIHTDKKELIRLGQSGRGTFVISGKVETYSDRIIVKEIPYKTTADAIVEDIRANMKGELKEIVSAKDLSDLRGLRIEILLKRGTNPRQVLKKINRLTKLRMQVSFNNSVIINNRCQTIGVWDLINEWIKFRLETVKRIHEFRADKRRAQVHELQTWDKIKGDIKGVVAILTNNTEGKAKELLMDKYDLDNIQSEYLLDMRIRLITLDRLKMKLVELAKYEAELKEIEDIVNNEEHRKRLIKKQLEEIIVKYGQPKKSIIVEPLPPETDEDREDKKVDDSWVTVVMTKGGYLKKLVTLREQTNFEADPSDPVLYKIGCRHNEDLLIFTYSGICYKIHVADIDDSRGVPKEYVYSLVQKLDDSPILTVMASGDYSGSFNVIYSNGKGRKIYLKNVSGNRSRYKSQFEPGAPGVMWITSEDKFFIITRKKNAAYINLEILGKISTRSSFKVARISNDDSIFGVQPASRVPNFDSIETEKYTKGYCVKIKDELWEKKEQ